MAGTSFLAFKKDDVGQILTTLDIATEKKGVKEFILDEKKEVAKCYVCDEKLTPENLGNIIKGSKILLCDNPSCFSGYLVEKKL